MGDATATKTLAPGAPQAEEKIYLASQWQLIWWRFRRNKLAIASAVILAIVFLLAAFCEFLAPYDPDKYDARYVYAPPQALHVFREGRLVRPFVYGYLKEMDPKLFQDVYKPDLSQVHPISFFVRGDTYKFWGRWKTNLHLFGVKGDGTVSLFGRDRMGRDMLSRILYGARISTTIGLVGVALVFILGIIIGGFSGYYGGAFDTFVQRAIEFLVSIPTLPLWMALSAALPPHWPPLRVYFGITIILSLMGWPGLARVVRSKFLSLREEDFVIAARLAGASDMRIILKHMLPSFMSYIIASVTLSLPGMILGETALSFLGIGLRPPTISWGVLLSEAQNIRAVALAPWLFIPGLFVIVTVLAFNFLGDGLRDAADPYAR